MRCRRLAPAALPEGSYQQPSVSYNGDRVLFSYCRAQTAPLNRESNLDRFYHLYEMGTTGLDLRQISEGPFDDFARIPSTARSSSSRPAAVDIIVAGGARARCTRWRLSMRTAQTRHPISFHETHEWDPEVLNDGRVLYTRWDYVDRNAVQYQQLWSVHPDGSDVRIFYGNRTVNPVGVWEAQAVPGSQRVMATAAAHHAMTAGSIILVDVTKGIDFMEPITRLTPDALFPESEAPVAQGPTQSRFGGPAEMAEDPWRLRRKPIVGRVTVTAVPIRCRRSSSSPPTVSTA